MLYVLENAANQCSTCVPCLVVPSRLRCPQASGLESLAPLVTSVEETPDPIPTNIKGTIPPWINGSFLRNGPGKFEFGNDRYDETEVD